MVNNIFGNQESVSLQEVESDFVGGSGPLRSNIYKGIIKYAYVDKARESEAKCLKLNIQIENEGEIAKTIWFTNKNGEIHYNDKKTGEKRNLPGFNQVDSLAMLVLGKSITQVDVEEKILKVYDYDKKEEAPKKVDCFFDFHNQPVQVAIQRQTIDKTSKNDVTGLYEPTGETVDVNEFVKFFPGDKLVTISEITQFINGRGSSLEDVLSSGEMKKAIQACPTGEFGWKWMERHEGKTRNRSTVRQSTRNSVRSNTRESLFEE